MITGTLKNWVKSGTDEVYIYWGNLYNDIKNRWADGQYIHTSMVVDEEDHPDFILVHTLNSTYLLRKEDKMKVTTVGRV
jgi:hypothetical protein